MPEAEINTEKSPLDAGTSRPVRIRVPSSGRRRKVQYKVIDNSGKELQNQEFELPGDVSEIAWYVDAPDDAKGSKLNMQVDVDSQLAANETIDIS